MKKSAKVCWAIGLLIFQMASTAILYLNDYGFVYFISILSESIPTIGAVILIFYDHKYNSPIIGNFTLLRTWSIVLIWVQPAISFLSWASAGLIDYVIGTWIGSCVFIIISTILLVYDGKEIVKKRKETTFDDSVENDLNKIAQNDLDGNENNVEETETDEPEDKTQQKEIFTASVAGIIVGIILFVAILTAIIVSSNL